MVNPYFLMRTIVLMLGDAILEVFQYTKARMQNVQPRMNRLHNGYPLLRAACTVFMRDVAAYLAMLDIVRGSPSIYVTYPGYDEVAHHSGPWTSDAFGALKRYDQVIRHVLRYIREKAPRPYELIILSDHGQSFGATFKQRYGVSLKEFIEQQLPAGTTVAEHIGGDTGITSLAGLSGELDNVQQQGMGGKVGGAVVKQGQQAAQRAVKESEGAAEPEAAQVVAYGSGNLAQVYFDLYPRRITLDELEAAFPGMVDALVPHEGIGVVAGYLDEDTPVVLGKGGRRNLHTGEVTGVDPLLPYGDVALRAWQVRRVMDFPHAGDLMVISTVYPDGTVAALEELIGNHGGMGGEQTDAFLFHPGDMVVPETRNSIDVFGILNARRGLPVVETPPVVEEQVQGWAPGNLLKGIFHQPSRWVGRALRALVLDRSAYSEVADDSYMTGPALLIMLCGPLDRDAVRAERVESGELCGPGRRLALGRGGAGARGASAGRPGGLHPDPARGGVWRGRPLPVVAGGDPAHQAAGGVPVAGRDLLCHVDRRGRGAEAARVARPGAADRGDCRVRHRDDCRAGAVRRRRAHAPVAGVCAGPGAVRMNDAGQVVTPTLSGFRCLPHACGRINQRVGGLREQGAIHNAVVFRRTLRIRSGGQP